MERSTHMKLANALSGLGAGMQGQGAQWMALQQKDMQLKDERRRKAMFQDAYQINRLLSSGDPADVQKALAMLAERRGYLKKLNADTSHTDAMFQRIQSGDIEGALKDTSNVLDMGYATGEFKRPPGPEYKVEDGQLITYGPGMDPSAQPIAGYQESPEAGLDRDIRERQLRLQEQIEERQQTKLSAGLEKYLIETIDAAEARRGDAIHFATLAQEYENRKDELYGGALANMNERWKAFFGDQDKVTEFRRQLNAIRISEGIGNLPPGVASDKDIELVMSGQIDANASPEQVVMYLRGAEKAAHYAAGYKQMTADYIDKHRKLAGINNAWRKAWDSERLGRKVYAAEIYQVAMSRGMSPQQVARDMGINGDLLGD